MNAIEIKLAHQQMDRAIGRREEENQDQEELRLRKELGCLASWMKDGRMLARRLRLFSICAELRAQRRAPRAVGQK